MTKYHVKSDGEFGICSVDLDKCPFSANDEKTIHVDSKEEAARIAEILCENYNLNKEISFLKNELKLLDENNEAGSYSEYGLFFEEDYTTEREVDPILESLCEGLRQWRESGNISDIEEEEDIVERECRKEGVLSRDDGPALELANGDKEWFLNGERHRIGGPAVERDKNKKEWWVNGKLHHVDGPAIDYTDSLKEHNLKGYWLNGKEYSQEEYEKKISEDKK